MRYRSRPRTSAHVRVPNVRSLHRGQVACSTGFFEGEEGVYVSCRDWSRSESGDDMDHWATRLAILVDFIRAQRVGEVLSCQTVIAPPSSHFQLVAKVIRGHIGQGMMISRAGASRLSWDHASKDRDTEFGTRKSGGTSTTVGMSKAELCHH